MPQNAYQSEPYSTRGFPRCQIARTDEEKAEMVNQYLQSVFTEQTYTAEKRVAHPTPLIDSIHFSRAEIKEAM